MESKGEENEENDTNSKEIKVYLDKDTEVAKVLKEALRDKKSNAFTHHKFILDADKDENNELQYDKEVLSERQLDILTNIQSKFREMTVKNASVDTGLTNNSIQFKDLDPETQLSS